MDERVADVQRYFNLKYQNGALVGMPIGLEANGKTGWPVMRALTRALQYELGMTTFSDAFGPTTMATLQQKYGAISNQSGTDRIRALVECALWCKGYSSGDMVGKFGSVTESSIVAMKTDMGLNSILPGPSVEPKVFKSLLTMDAYVTVPGGRPEVRSVQQWLNSRYLNRSDYQIVPCDGLPSRNTAKSLIYAVQYELGMSDATANGVFGPGTQAGLRSHLLAVGATGPWAQLFTAALIFNGQTTAFGDFTPAVSTKVREFQAFAKLTVTGTATYETWASLLISYGDQTRPASACDGVTRITPARAVTLKNAGIKYVGRYLSALPTSTLPEKVIQPGELADIAASGLRCFPIYQTLSRELSYFSATQGRKDAAAAIEWAKFFGFQNGTIIYFAVDYDAQDAEIQSNIIPHFRAISEGVQGSSGFKVGVYGPRNVCQSVSDAGFALTSFVSDMSSGFSGNFGYPLPTNWAFDQIATKKIGSGDAAIEIDRDVASGRDIGQASFKPMTSTSVVDRPSLPSLNSVTLSELQKYCVSIGLPERGGEKIWVDPDGNIIVDDDVITKYNNSTTDSFNEVMRLDPFVTNICAKLGIRKALIQAPLFWEIRQFNPGDVLADDAVMFKQRDDSTTGPGQIYAHVAMEARNYCRSIGLLSGPELLPEQQFDVWVDLHTNEQYNVETMAYLTIWNAHDLGMPRPNLDISAHAITQLLARYNGTNEDAAKYGQDTKGVYDVFERFNSLARY